jgi:hypothetical protein
LVVLAQSSKSLVIALLSMISDGFAGCHGSNKAVKSSFRFARETTRRSAPLSGGVAWRSLDPPLFLRGSVRRSRGEATGRIKLIRTPDRWFYAECPRYYAEAWVQTGSAYVLVRHSVLTQALDFPPKLL